MADEELVDQVAEGIRTAYAESAPGPGAEHIYAHPWVTLPAHRREKWRAMARAAIEDVTEHLRTTDGRLS